MLRHRRFECIIIVVLGLGFRDPLEVGSMGHNHIDAQIPQHPIYIMGFRRILDENMNLVIPQCIREGGHSSVIRIEPSELLVEVLQELFVLGFRFAFAGEPGTGGTFVLVDIHSYSDNHLIDSFVPHLKTLPGVHESTIIYRIPPMVRWSRFCLV